MRSIKIYTSIRNPKVIKARIDQLCRNARKTYSFPKDIRIADPLLLRNVSIATAIQKEGGYLELSQRVTKWLLQGYGTGALTASIESKFVNDFKLCRPVSIFGKTCTDTAECQKELGEFGILLGLLEASVRFETIDQTSIGPEVRSIRPQTSRFAFGELNCYKSIERLAKRPETPDLGELAGQELTQVDALVNRLYVPILRAAASLKAGGIIYYDKFLGHNRFPIQRPSTAYKPTIPINDPLVENLYAKVPPLVALKAGKAKDHIVLCPAGTEVDVIFMDGYRTTDLDHSVEHKDKDMQSLLVIQHMLPLPRYRHGHQLLYAALGHYLLCRRNTSLNGRFGLYETAWDPVNTTLLDLTTHRENSVILTTRRRPHYDNPVYRLDDETYYVCNTSREALTGPQYFWAGKGEDSQVIKYDTSNDEDTSFSYAWSIADDHINYAPVCRVSGAILDLSAEEGSDKVPEGQQWMFSDPRVLSDGGLCVLAVTLSRLNTFEDQPSFLVTGKELKAVMKAGVVDTSALEEEGEEGEQTDNETNQN